MSTTEVQNENGYAQSEKFQDILDQDLDPEFKRQLLRPAEVKEDVNLMEQRKRVSLLLNSEVFRRELEEVMENYSRANDSTGLNSSLLSLQHLSELLSTIPGKRPLTGGCFSKGTQGGIIPINDLRGTEAGLYSRRERIYRCKLASVYRLISLFGWSSNIYNHATVRLNRNTEQFLVNPFGLLYHEVTASSFIKIDSQCEVIDPGSTVLGVNKVGWRLHSAVHSARPDIRCIIHIGTPATIAISCMKSGLLPISQEAIVLGEVGYYDAAKSTMESSAEGDASTATFDSNNERVLVGQALQPETHILFIRSRGFLALGDTIEEAWHYAANGVVACETQLRLASIGVDHLVLPSASVRQRAYQTWRTTELGGICGPEAAIAVRMAHARSLSPSHHHRNDTQQDGYLSDRSTGPEVSRPWRLGELEFEALMRHLDNAGYRTGHNYRKDFLPSPQQSRRTLDRSGACSHGVHRYDDVEVPPYTSSAAATMSAYYDEGVFSGDESEAPKPGTLRRQWCEHPWFNTPNSYNKTMMTSFPGHRPVPHWVSSREATLQSQLSEGKQLPPPAPFPPLTPAAFPLGSIGGLSSTPNRLTSYNTFAPQGSNPKEYLDQQKRVKAKYYHDTNTAGPQSRLLDGLTWDEARRIRDEALAKSLGPGAVSDSFVSQPTVAAASKAILQRDVRDAAVVYDGVYVKRNPFDQITDEELAEYKHEIEIKNNPALYAEWLRQKTSADATKQAHISASATDADLSFSVEESSPLCSSSFIVPGSELHDLRGSLSMQGGHLSPPVVTSGVTSELSEVDEAHSAEKKEKKKRRFKLPSFARKTRTKEKKIISD